MARRAIIPALAITATVVHGQAPTIKAQIEAAEHQARAHPADASAAGNFAMTLHAYGEYQAAAKAYQRASALDPRSFDWAYLLGAAQFSSGDFDSAAASFETAVSLRPADLAARFRLAQSLAAIANWDRAVQQYQAVLRDHPDCAQAWYGLGRAQAAAGDHAAAVGSYTKACDLSPQYGPAHFALAAELRKLGRRSDAERHLAAYRRDPLAEPPLDDPLFLRVSALNHSAQMHLQRGAELDKSGQIAAAIQEHEAALAADPGNVQARVNLISLYARANRPDKATGEFDAVIRAHPGRSDAWYNYGVLLLQQEKVHDAENAFHRAVDINPSYPEAHFNLGVIAERDGRVDEAAHEFEQAITASPDNSTARFHLGRILVNQQRYEDGIRQLIRSLENAGEQRPRNLYALGAAYARAGDRRHALQYLGEARNAAQTAGQKVLLEAIDRDLAALEGNP